MSWERTLDLASKAVTRAYKVPCVFVLSGNPPQSLPSIFDAEFEHITLDGDGVAHSTLKPMVDVRLSDLAHAPKMSDRVTVTSRGVTQPYHVTDIEADGCGHAKLFLAKTL